MFWCTVSLLFSYRISWLFLWVIHVFFWLTYLYTVELITCSIHFYGFWQMFEIVYPSTMAHDSKTTSRHSFVVSSPTSQPLASTDWFSIPETLPLLWIYVSVLIFESFWPFPEIAFVGWYWLCFKSGVNLELLS